MRSVTLLTLVLLAGITICGAADQQPKSAPKRGAETAAQMAEMIEQLVQTVFTSADTNHNRYLSKREFGNAEAMLATAVNDWGRQGLIGKPGKQKKSDVPQSTNNLADAQGARLAKNNRISQPEFAIYVHAVAEQADQDWRAARATAEAQRKAYNQFRSYYRARRGNVPVPRP